MLYCPRGPQNSPCVSDVFSAGPNGPKGQFSSGLQPHKRQDKARRFDGAWFLSQRDSTIVAGHEVPGARSAWNHEENRPVPAGRLNRSRLRSDDNDFTVPPGQSHSATERPYHYLGVYGLQPRAMLLALRAVGPVSTHAKPSG